MANAVVAPPPADRVQFAQLTIQQRIVVRVPITPLQSTSQPAARWVERKGPKCIPLAGLGGFVVRTPQVVDLFLRGGQRFRARLERQCSATDLSYGFYVKPHADGRICADRDSLHARTGGKCEVERFTTLTMQR